MNPLTVIPPEAYGDWVILAGWRGPYEGGVLFPNMHPEKVPLILRIEGPNAWKTEEQSVETVTPPPPETRNEINGKPVVFGECPCALHIATLYWIREDDGVAYTLTANLEVVSREDLFRVAETIR